jgi:hypothetical protein
MVELKGQLGQRRRFTLGADPEMFLFENNKLIPAYEFLPKKRESADFIFWDGFQAEWKYSSPIYCQNNLVKATREKMMLLQAKAQKKFPNARLSLRNVVRIPKETLETALDHYVELGCKPSYNAYGMRGIDVINPRTLPYRFAGGHMHFGTWEGRRPNYKGIISTLDAVLGVWGVGAARNLDVPVRRQYYGLAGEYRMPTYSVDPEFNAVAYGVEYRTLSNFWLCHPAIMQLTWEIGRQAVRLATSKYRKFWVASKEEVIETINNCDTAQAEKILKRNKGMFLWMLNQKYHDFKTAAERGYQVAFKGVEEFVGDPNDLPRTWHFNAEWILNGGAQWARWSSYQQGL